MGFLLGLVLSCIVFYFWFCSFAVLVFESLSFGVFDFFIYFSSRNRELKNTENKKNLGIHGGYTIM